MKSLIFCLFFAPVYAQIPASNWDHEMVEVLDDKRSGVLMTTQPIFDDKWNELQQPLFWKKIMALHPDSCIINVASTRQILMQISAKEWNKKTEKQKSALRDSLKTANGILATEKLFCTGGKNHFYKFDSVYGSLSKGIIEFENNRVDPWYAQAILLIESPGQLVKSNVGAYGAFQLMPYVARSQGLVVNKKIDERKDFKRSAYAASSFIRKTCIPQAKKILDAQGLSYSENDLWFRLFVMHVYHAGAQNVKAVVKLINPLTGGQDLITKMWQTTVGGFGNASQNYTQLVLASQLILQEMVGDDSVRLFECEDAK